MGKGEGLAGVGRGAADRLGGSLGGLAAGGALGAAGGALGAARVRGAGCRGCPLVLTLPLSPQEISYFFLEPFRAGPCHSYPSCLACLADQGCGWCPLSASCHGRLEGPGGGGPCGGGSVRLVLSPSNCFLCEEYRDCHACSAVRRALGVGFWGAWGGRDVP